MCRSRRSRVLTKSLYFAIVFASMPNSNKSSSGGKFGRSPQGGPSSHFKKRFGVSKGGRPYNRTSGGYKPGGFSSGGRANKFKHQEFRDISRFIHKAVITEQAPGFVH